MSNEQASSNTAQSNAGWRCACNDVRHEFERLFNVPPEVRQHLANSRIEFLKAIRAAIDHRIDNLAGKGQQGSHIAVE